ncbi:MAG: LssY C-terminal domain-containing protein [Rhodospirillales bacterium]|nr:MAG: LssY C-terminal domain-containing protein [Rhodospirillales bacterium]
MPTRCPQARTVGNVHQWQQGMRSLFRLYKRLDAGASEHRPFSRRWLAAAVVCLAVAGCGSRSFQPESAASVGLLARAEVQSEDGLTVRAAVPGREETERLFGVPLYDRGIQPVWLEIENRGPARVRVAHTSIDRDYHSPLEVAYLHRKSFSGPARTEMETYYHKAAIPRFVRPGETKSGFVFTNARPGTKAFNVDLFGADRNDHSFTFFIDVPGFVPDHAEVNFENLYTAEQVAEIDAAGLRESLAILPQYATDANGTARGDPVNVIFVAHGLDLRSALLRSGWQETPAGSESDKAPGRSVQFLYDRPPDAILRKGRGEDDRNELRIWLAPMRVDGRPVWLAQVTHHLPGLFGIEYQDPDLDEARYYLLQTLWYGQSLKQLAWRAAIEPVAVSEPVLGFRRRGYFTDGYQLVLWPSGDPVSLIEVVRLRWDARTGQ